MYIYIYSLAPLVVWSSDCFIVVVVCPWFPLNRLAVVARHSTPSPAPCPPRLPLALSQPASQYLYCRSLEIWHVGGLRLPFISGAVVLSHV